MKLKEYCEVEKKPLGNLEVDVLCPICKTEHKIGDRVIKNRRMAWGDNHPKKLMDMGSKYIGEDKSKPIFHVCPKCEAEFYMIALKDGEYINDIARNIIDSRVKL